MTIERSVVIRPGIYFLPADSNGAVRIRGSDLIIDFSGATLVGSERVTRPDTFQGVGILIGGGTRIVVRNVSVRGYRIGLLAEGIDSLVIEKSDFSYNYRQHLKSTLEREHLDDWMSYHHNEHGEWQRYGAGIYLDRVRRPVLRDITITGGQNGLLLTRVDDGLIFNNTITFNSGLGIGLYRSSRNRIQHNVLDYNVRGYSHGVYNRGQDSAAILVYEQSNNNIFAFNSATHSGDGFFLWAGQSTMDTGEGGCNDNRIYGNDFSYAPTNGIEVTFSRNRIERNRISGCWHGIWGGYSYETIIGSNLFIDNEEHIAIEHGQEITITDNMFSGGSIGVRAWERERQPDDWGYSANRDVRSRDYVLEGNRFSGVRTPLSITDTDSVRESTTGQRAEPVSDTPASIPDGRDVLDSRLARLDRSFILVDDWGPYDFRSPVIWPRSPRQAREQTFEILGPPGTWTIKGIAGIDSVSSWFGQTGDQIVAWVQDYHLIDLTIDLTYVGSSTVDRFGREIAAGERVPFSYHYFYVPIEWHVGWFAYEEVNDPRTHPDAFRALLDGTPTATDTTRTLAYQFYRAPAEGIPADHFATRAEGMVVVPDGDYVLEITSDDGVRVVLDGRIVYEDWTWHAPRQAEISLHLNGRHAIRIDHFEIDGYSALRALLRRPLDD